ncbi:MAG: Proton-translocating NADH-quinone oxidoreductase, chain, partial [Pedosphaera sp.]|nr:Proton-translocating NADH-quinone oxidoreductase, chain [Pedosphaera sp.]
RAMRNAFYFDDLYEKILIPCPQEALAKLADAIDRRIIAGFVVRGSQGTTELVGRALRLLQTGSLQTYAFLLVAGVAVVLYFILVR